MPALGGTPPGAGVVSSRRARRRA